MKEVIEDIYKNKTLCAIYEEDLSKFAVGYLMQISDNEIIMQEISPYGEDDGLTLFLIENIRKIEIDNKYLAAIKLLSCDIEDYVIQRNRDLDLLSNVLEYSMKKEYIVSIELSNEGYYDCIGIINHMNNQTLKVDAIDEYGESEGSIFVNFSEITKMTINSLDDRKRNKLYKLNINS